MTEKYNPFHQRLLINLQVNLLNRKKQSRGRSGQTWTNFNQAMNDRNAIRKRLIKYVGTVLFLSIVFNINKVPEILSVDKVRIR